MEWYLNIPKIFHVYWGGETLTYLRFMTIVTFMKRNPDWEITFLYPKEITKHALWLTYENKFTEISCTNFLPNLMELPIKKVQVDFSEYGISNSIPEVHKSDFIRLIQLSQFGGLWSDMDIFYIRPINDFYLNNPQNKNIETFICNNEYGHSIGFMMASKGNKFFATLAELAVKEYDSRYYQTFGAILYNKYFDTMDKIEAITPAINFSMDVVYPIIAGNEKKFIDGSILKLGPKTLGAHWYAGHPQWIDFLTKTNGGLNNLPRSIIGNLIKYRSG